MNKPINLEILLTLDGWKRYQSKTQPFAQIWGLGLTGDWEEIPKFTIDYPLYTKLPDYVGSRDAIVPVVVKWMTAKGDSEQTARSTKFNYALTDILDRDNPRATEDYGWTWILVIAATAAQIAEALFNVVEESNE